MLFRSKCVHSSLGAHGIRFLTIYIVLYVNNGTITPSFIIMGYNERCALPASKFDYRETRRREQSLDNRKV